MPLNPIVLSSSSTLTPDFSNWLESMENLRRIQFEAYSVGLELTTRRAGFEGMFEDNPPIETIDAVRQAADERRIPFRSIFLPVNLSPADDKIGLEISNINGWTDLASYLGIPHVRLRLVSRDANSPFRSLDILEPVIRYMHTGDLHVSLSASDTLLPPVLEWLREYNRTAALPVGRDCSDAKEIGQWKDVPVGSVTVAMDQWEKMIKDEISLDPQVLIVFKI